MDFFYYFIFISYNLRELQGGERDAKVLFICSFYLQDFIAGCRTQFVLTIGDQSRPKKMPLHSNYSLSLLFFNNVTMLHQILLLLLFKL